MPDVIDSFRGKYHILSNFHATDIDMDGIIYPTVEHAYQAAKTDNTDERRKVAALETPSKAKSYGRRMKRPANWFDYNLDLMESLILQKFTRYPDLCEKLLATGDAELIEGNIWNDRFFGMVRDKQTGEWTGKNHLGQMLIRVRQQLRDTAAVNETESNI